MTRARLRAAVAAVLVFCAITTPASAFDNGRLPASAVSPIATGLNCPALGSQLANPAAAGYNTMALSAGKVLPVNGCMSAYRTYAQQVYLATHCPAVCARPGTSNHGLGRAVDVPTWVRSVIDRTHGRYGFDKACSDAPTEPWHVVFCRSFSRPNPGIDLQSPTLRIGSGGSGQHAFVKEAQRLLNRHGFTTAVDGEFGPKTARAVQRFQESQRLRPDGVMGPHTWRQLRKPAHGPGPKPKPTPKPKPHRHEHWPLPQVRGGAYDGIDVSQAQGDVAWGKVHDAGKELAIAKCCEGADWRDPTFSPARMRAMADAHLLRGVYTYMRPQAGRSGAVEANWLVNVARDAGWTYGDLKLILDVETTTLSPAGTCAYVHQAVERVRALTHSSPIVYTYPGFARAHLAGCGDWLTALPNWRAHYGVSTPDTFPWKATQLFQFSDHGSVGGESPVDLNRVIGGTAALRSLIYKDHRSRKAKLSNAAKFLMAKAIAETPPPLEPALVHSGRRGE